MILILAPNLADRGGIQEYSRKFIRALKENNIRNSVLELKSTSPWNKLLFVASFLYRSLFLKPDLIAAMHIGFAPLCFRTKRLLKIKYFISAHGIEVWNLKKNKKKFLREADSILSVSNFTKDKILEQMPDLGSKIKILPNTVDGEEFYIKHEDLRSKYGFKPEDKIIFTLARLSKLEKYKGYDKVIEIMPDILREFPVSKYLIGGDGDDAARIKNIIKNLGLENKIILLGKIPKEKLVDYYNLADVFVMPSKGEGFGIVFLEAMACGTPVVGGNIDGSVDALAHGELGMLVNPDNNAEFSRAVVGVLRGDAPARLKDPEELRRGVLMRFGFDIFVSKLSSLVNEVISR